MGGEMKYIAFDIEITKEIPEGTEDITPLRPLGISCAATLDSDGNLVTWFEYPFSEDPEALYSSKMSPYMCQGMLDYLIDYANNDYDVITWNGLGFDFDILAEECDSPLYRQKAVELARRHIDIGFAMFCDKGFMIGLDTACKGMGLLGKTEGMHGDLAPAMWAKSRADQDKVLEYVAGDVRATAQVYEAIMRACELKWISKTGKLNTWKLPNGLFIPKVEQALELPVPETKWMTNPWPREKFSGWLNTQAKLL